MNCIIVDDDSISCKILEGYVEKYPDLQLIGTFTSSFEARNAIIQHSDIELIFLDIMMPEMNGFDFLESLEYPPHIIIVSATEEYAIKAFDYNVTDYLLKPINYGRFCKAVDKIFRYFVKQDPSKSGDKELFIKNGSSLVKLKMKDIAYIEALENYVSINTSTGKYIVHFTMKGITNIIPSNLFVRTQRSFIVNKNMIQSISDTHVELAIGESTVNIPLGKSFRNDLLSDINIMSK